MLIDGDNFLYYYIYRAHYFFNLFELEFYFQPYFTPTLLDQFWKTNRWRTNKLNTGCFCIRYVEICHKRLFQNLLLSSISCNLSNSLSGNGTSYSQQGISQICVTKGEKNWGSTIGTVSNSERLGRNSHLKICCILCKKLGRLYKNFLNVVHGCV